MKALKVTPPGGESTLYPLKNDLGFCYTIGRAEGCRILIAEDGRLSRRHCSVSVQAEGIVIKDLNSSNGTLRGEEEIREERMQPHVVYTAGRTQLVYIDSEVPAPQETGKARKADTDPHREPEKKKKSPKLPHPVRTAEKGATSKAPGTNVSQRPEAPQLRDSERPEAPQLRDSERPEKKESETTNAEEGDWENLPPSSETDTERLLFDSLRDIAGFSALGLIIVICCLYFTFRPAPDTAPEQVHRHRPGATQQSGADKGTAPEEGDSADEDTDKDDIFEGLADTDDTVYPTPTPGLRVPARGDNSYDEEDVPEDPKQRSIPKARPHADFTKALAKAHQLEKVYAKTEKGQYIDKELRGACFRDSYAVYQETAERVLQRLGKADEAAVFTFLESPANRLDLARLTIIRRLGTDAVNDIANSPRGTEFLCAVMRDLNWCNGILHNGPSGNLEQCLRNLFLLYTKDRGSILEDEVIKKTATACAMEFGRFGWDSEQMVRRYFFYRDSYREGYLNKTYKQLQYWDMRFVTGCPPSAEEEMAWGNVRNLTWLRDHVRLPAEQYTGACWQVDYRLRNVAGDSVFSDDYLGPVAKYTNKTIAWAHREIGGVCGALSHYGAFSAMANGIAACAVGEPGHCSFTVRVGKEWHASNTISWKRQVGKNFWGHGEWEYLILTQKVYDEHFKTLVSENLMALADFLGSRKKMTAAFNCYETALRVQPLLWPSYGRYAGYLKLKAAGNAEKWQNLHDFIAQGIGKTYYCATADLMRECVYPGLAPHMKDSVLRNRRFAAFFNHYKDWGIHRWDIKPLLNAQMSYCTDLKEQLNYIHDVLFVLMARRDYAGSVLSWGLDYVAHNVPEKDRDKVYNMLILSMARTKVSKKEADATWAIFGEAMSAAEENRDHRAFQAIGRLAHMRMRKRFHNRSLRAPRFPGSLLSEKGLFLPQKLQNGLEDPQACYHWAALQRFGGGAVKADFESTGTGPEVHLPQRCEITGATMVLSKVLNEHEQEAPFALMVSDDLQHWEKVVPKGNYDVKKSFVTFDARRKHVQGRYVKFVRLGEKIDLPVNGVYVYGRILKE